MCNLVGGVVEGEYDGEYFGWDLQCFVDDVVVEVDVWVQFVGDEVVVLQCGLFQFDGYVEQWVLYVKLFEYFVGYFIDDFGVWVEVFVYVVVEVYQVEVGGFVFGFEYSVFDVVG